MSVFRVFQRFFAWVVFAPLVSFVLGEPLMSPAFGRSCSSYLYRAYDGRDSVKLYQISYTPGSQLPTEDVDRNTLVAPTRNGYTFNGFYKGSDQFYDSTLTRPGNAPNACVDFSAKWGLVGCDLGVVNQIEGWPAVVLTTAGSASVDRFARPVRWIAQNEPHRLQGFAACSAIPGGYDDSSGYSTASTSDISNSASGDNCWCRLVESNVRLTGNSSWSTSLNQPYTRTQWVYAGTVTDCAHTANDCHNTCAQMASSVGSEYDAFRSALYGMNCPFTITYHNISGHTNTALGPTDYTFEKTPVNLQTPIPSVSGEAFLGWYKNSSFTGSAITQITYSDLLATGDQDVYARWGYNVSYNCGSGGSGTPPATHGCAAGQSCTVASTAGGCSKSGDTVQGWSCTGGGNTFDAALGGTFTMPSSAVTCIAQWHCEIGEINKKCPLQKLDATEDGFDPNFVSINTSPFSVIRKDLFPGEWSAKFSYGMIRGNAACSTTGGSNMQFSISSTSGANCWCKPTLYSDDGSFTSGHAEGVKSSWYHVSYDGSQSSSNCETVCAEACAKQVVGNRDVRGALYKCDTSCQPNVCFVDYNNVSNGNETWPSSRITPSLYTAETPVSSFTVSNPGRSTHQFVSWCENAGLSTNCEGTKTINTNSCTIDSSTKNLYAKWGACTCTEGTGVESGTCSASVSNNQCVYDWRCNSGYQPSVTVPYTLTSGSSYTALCAPNPHIVTYAVGNHAASGSSNHVVNNVDYGSTHTVLSNTDASVNILPDTGYVFSGWSCNNGIGNKTAGETFPMPDANVTCTAQWAQCSCTNGNHSTCGNTALVTNNTCGYDWTCDTGYNYGGNTSGTVYAAVAGVGIVQAPNCSRKVLGMTVDKNSGTGNVTVRYRTNDSTSDNANNLFSVTGLYYGDSVTMPAFGAPDNTLTKPGYGFIRWECFDSHNNQINLDVNNTFVMPFDSGVTCQAQYGANKIIYLNTTPSDIPNGITLPGQDYSSTDLPITVPSIANTPSLRSHATFGGWCPYDVNTFTQGSCSLTQTISVAGPKIFIANWSCDTGYSKLWDHLNISTEGTSTNTNGANWTVNFGNESPTLVLNGEARLAPLPIVSNNNEYYMATTDDLDNAGTGGGCWCKLNSFQDNETTQNTTSQLWVLGSSWSNDFSSVNDCAENCAYIAQELPLVLSYMESSPLFEGLFYSVAPFSNACEPNRYHITYNEGSHGVATVSGMPVTNPEIVYYGDTYTLASAPSATGYVFTGWRCPGLSQSDLAASATGTYNYTGDVTCTAQWVPIHTITFKTGNTVMGTQTCNEGTTVTLDNVSGMSNIPVNTTQYDVYGWQFNGWQTVSHVNGTTRDYTNGANYVCSADITLYGLWKRDVLFGYVASYVSNTTYRSNVLVYQYYGNIDASSAGATDIITPSSSSIPSFASTDQGWTPIGWAKKPNLQPVVGFQETVTYGITEPKAAFQAIYERTPQLTYAGNDSTGGSTLPTNCAIQRRSALVSSTVSCPVAYNGFTRTGYVFTDWNAAANGTGTSYSAGGVYTFTNAWGSNSTSTLYAQWCPCSGVTCTPGTNVSSCSMTGTVTNNACNYSFNCNSGYNYSNSSSGTGSAAAGSCPASVTSPACSGNILDLEWYLGANHTNQWTGNGVNPASCIYGTPYTNNDSIRPLSIPSSHPAGYVFDGWKVTYKDP